jgi:enediyne biosynthesis protein E4
MNRSHARTLITILFALLVLTPLVMARWRVPGRASAAKPGYGFSLQEVARASGIDFVHQAPKLDAALDAIMPEIASMGASVSVVDVNGDGWPDFYVTNSAVGSRNALYLNQKDGTFRDGAAEAGIADVNRPGTGVSMGAVWADYDNDGHPDLALYKWGPVELFHNDGHGRFTDVTKEAGLGQRINANHALWCDVNRDGLLDLFVAGYYPDGVDLWHLKNTRMMPESFDYADNGGHKYLFLNRGHGRFEDVTARYHLDSHRWTLAAGAADVNGDGYPDLYLANDYGYDQLYINQGGRSFQEQGRELGVGKTPGSGMCVAFGDYLNEDKLALYVTNITKAGFLQQGNNLWAPMSEGGFRDLAPELGLADAGWSFGAQFGDLNNDGTLDLFVANGFISANPDKSYWYHMGKISLGNASIISDAKNWPPLADMSLSGYERSCVFLNDGAGKFFDVATAAGADDPYDGRGVALADLWNTGALDVIVANQKGPVVLYRNQIEPGNGWIELDLTGTKSNRDAIGAEVTLFWNGQRQRQVLSGGIGFASQNEHRLHFGLGASPQVEKAVIRWPSGREQTVTGLKVGAVNRVREPA